MTILHTIRRQPYFPMPGQNCSFFVLFQVQESVPQPSPLLHSCMHTHIHSEGNQKSGLKNVSSGASAPLLFFLPHFRIFGEGHMFLNMTGAGDKIATEKLC